MPNRAGHHFFFADEKQFLGIVAVADVVKPTSKEAVQKFRDYGIHVIMLTGDNEVTAQAIKEQVGIDEVVAGVLPTQKEEKISALKQAGHKVAMIGDGVNDAPGTCLRRCGNCDWGRNRCSDRER